MKRLVLESTAPFQGLPELVAYDEGLFEKEGLDIEWVDRDAGAEKKKTVIDVTSPRGLNPFTSHGRLFEQGRADMYNACEWGNYCRVQETGIKSRQPRRRAIIAYGAIVVPPASPSTRRSSSRIARSACRSILARTTSRSTCWRASCPREADQGVPCPERLPSRLASLRRGEIEATTLTEPYITLAEKQGCRTICSGSSTGRGRVRAVDAQTYAAFNARCAKRCGASMPTSAPTSLLHRLPRPDDPEIAALTIDDLRESRLVVCDPAPIPSTENAANLRLAEELGMLEGTASPVDLVDLDVSERRTRRSERPSPAGPPLVEMRRIVPASRTRAGEMS